MKTMEENISSWEAEGGSLNERLVTPPVIGPEWAERIRVQVNAKFDRAANTLQALALKQSRQGRLKIFAMMLILEERRGEVLLSERAGCFIHDWQERELKLGQLVKTRRPC